MQHLNALTYTIDEDARQDEVKHVKHRSASQLNSEGDVRVRLRTARVIGDVLRCRKFHQVEFPVGLVVRHVPGVHLLYEIQLGTSSQGE